VILKYAVMSHCGAKCSSLLRVLYSVKLCKIMNCTELQRKFIFRFSGMSKYAFLQAVSNSSVTFSGKSENNDK
jgi:hypothetical protein